MCSLVSDNVGLTGTLRKYHIPSTVGLYMYFVQQTLEALELGYSLNGITEVDVILTCTVS